VAISESIGVSIKPDPRDLLASDIHLPQIQNLEQLNMVTDLESSDTSEFRAYQSSTHRQVTVRLFTGSRHSEGFRAFNQHQKIASRLAGHAAIVPILDAGATSDGHPYTISPYYARGSMARFMAEHGPVAWRHGAFLLELVAVTVAELHGSRIAHRALRPGAIELTDYLMPRVSRFEQSLRFDTQPSNSLTLEHSSYLAPEVISGAPAAPTSDVFGLGAIMWALIAGYPPPSRSVAGADSEAAFTEPLETLPDSISGLIMRSMDPDPRLRPSNGAAFVTALRRSVGLAETQSRTSRDASSVMSSLVTSETVEITEAERQAADASAGEPKVNNEPVNEPSDAESTTNSQSVAEEAAATTVMPQDHTSIALVESVRSADADARWLLAIVGVITITIVLMVASAILAFQ